MQIYYRHSKVLVAIKNYEYVRNNKVNGVIFEFLTLIMTSCVQLYRLGKNENQLFYKNCFIFVGGRTYNGLDFPFSVIFNQIKAVCM